MKHLFIPYELAVIAKEKGFDESCLAYYNDNGKLIKKWIAICPSNYSCAPLYQQIVDWFRKEKCILIYPIYNCKYEYRVESSIDTANDGIIVSSKGWQQTQNKAIEEAFKLI